MDNQIDMFNNKEWFFKMNFILQKTNLYMRVGRDEKNNLI